MGFRERALLASLAVAACVVAGCGGGSGGGTSPPPPTAVPAIITRPLAAGNTFQYSGTTVDTKIFYGSNPNGSSTVTSQVTQSVVVSGPVAYNGLANAFDFKTSETDTAPLQQIGITTDTYYGTRPGASTGLTQFVTSGYTSSDTLGERIAVALGPGNQLADILPETAGRTWSNDGAQTFVRLEADGTNETRTDAGDGSYVDTTTYPQGSQFTPQPAPLTATIAEKSDGSGVYSLPLFGNSPNVTISFGTPNPAGRVPIVVANPGPLETANPIAFYSPGPLYKETDVTGASGAIPTACHAGAAFGTTADAIQQTAKRIDAILGTIESFSQMSYVVPKYGVACIVLSDKTDAYYDYSGQSNVGPAGIAFNGGPSPTEVDTLTTTLGLTGGTVQAMSLHPGAAVAATGLRFANARSNFIATVERRRFERTKRALRILRAALVRRHPGLLRGETP